MINRWARSVFACLHPFVSIFYSTFRLSFSLSLSHAVTCLADVMNEKSTLIIQAIRFNGVLVPLRLDFYPNENTFFLFLFCFALFPSGKSSSSSKQVTQF